MRLIYTLALCAALTGCTALQALQDAPEGEDGPLVLLQVAQADVAAAEALARAAGDEAAMACWPALRRWLVHLEDYRMLAEGSEGSGVAVAYQRARNVRRRVDAGVPAGVEIACAAMVNESRSVFGRLILRLGLRR